MSHSNRSIERWPQKRICNNLGKYWVPGNQVWVSKKKCLYGVCTQNFLPTLIISLDILPCRFKASFLNFLPFFSFHICFLSTVACSITELQKTTSTDFDPMGIFPLWSSNKDFLKPYFFTPYSIWASLISARIIFSGYG